jgi:hypothetical protein
MNVILVFLFFFISILFDLVFSKQNPLPNHRIKLDHGDLALRIDDILSRRVEESGARRTHELDGDGLALATGHHCWDGGMHDDEDEDADDDTVL